MAAEHLPGPDSEATEADAAIASVRPGQRLAFVYRNWEGKVASRQVMVLGLAWGSTDWHPTPGWLLEALDLDKKQVRLFAMGDISGLRCIAPPDAGRVPTPGLVDHDREELRARACKALAAAPTNDHIRGYRGAWGEVLGLLAEQDAMFAQVAAMPGGGQPRGSIDAAPVAALSLALGDMRGPSAASHAVLLGAAASLLALHAELESYRLHGSEEYMSGYRDGAREAEDRIRDDAARVDRPKP